MSEPIAIVGMACVYPDANSPAELWENVLAQRRSFRRLPDQRTRPADYYSPDLRTPDATYAVQAAVVEGYDFDRVAFRIVGSTFRSVDLVHWLALDVASRAMADAGFPEADGLCKETTGVILGNTLTGEFSRANVMRLRWPYVRRVLEEELQRRHWDTGEKEAFLTSVEEIYKAPFPPVGEESLAGGLSNTIAGRICNQYNLKGGGYTVDGACASSLLAICQSCTALKERDLDVALVGGVDLSLDPFELVGFAKAAALAEKEMRVYDRHSAGFWPGEGCGFVVLMRMQDAMAMGCRIYGVIQGWGISSDGTGGITRPELEGQQLALERAYRKAGFPIGTVACFEGHGTGTAVGDATEIRALTSAIQSSDRDPSSPKAALSSVKANIGHTKAAAGIAGVIKGVMAIHQQVLPPATGNEEPHSWLAGKSPVLRIMREAEVWPSTLPLRLGVSAMGFGGINTHVVLEGNTAERRSKLKSKELTLSRSPQDAELFVFGGSNPDALKRQLAKVAGIADRLSLQELQGLSAYLCKTTAETRFRAALVSSTPADLAESLHCLLNHLEAEKSPLMNLQKGLFYQREEKRVWRIGFLFPGQASPPHLTGGRFRRRFAELQDLFQSGESEGSDSVCTAVAQPSIVSASIAGLRLLRRFGIEADLALGHSLGELSALHWGGVFSENDVISLAKVRGNAMASLGSPTGAMAAVAAPVSEIAERVEQHSLQIVGLNSPRQTVVAGEREPLLNFMKQAQANGLQAVLLPVSHAFHTSLVAAAEPVIAQHLQQQQVGPLLKPVVSTVTGDWLFKETDVADLIRRQITSPVRFMEAVMRADPQVDLWVEVGPGHVLSRLLEDMNCGPVLPLDVGGSSLRSFLIALGALYTFVPGTSIPLFHMDREVRPFDLEAIPKFFTNPCELAPRGGVNPVIRPPIADTTEESGEETNSAEKSSPLEILKQVTASRTELPVTALADENRMLSDLHLNSISVAELISKTARLLKIPAPQNLTDFANASLLEIAQVLEKQKAAGRSAKTEQENFPKGIRPWVRCFAVKWVECPVPKPRPKKGQSHWQLVIREEDHDPWSNRLKQLLARMAGSGVVVLLPPSHRAGHEALLLQGARALRELPEGVRSFVVLETGESSSAFARTLHLEIPDVVTLVMRVAKGDVRTFDWLAREIEAASGFREVCYDAQGRRWEPRLQVEGFKENRSWDLSSNDVLLVTGGGKGIAAECVLSLARQTQVRLGLLGRSPPGKDRELDANLHRFSSHRVVFHYVPADVTDPGQVEVAVQAIADRLGPVTGVLHSAGNNSPKLLDAMEETEFHQTVAPKMQGLENVLASVDTEKVRLLVTFGSIIARTGLKGEAHYGVANQWLSERTEQFHVNHPGCRCLALEWSVWSQLGMGQRLGRITALRQQGIEPIPPEEGVAAFLNILRSSETPRRLIVASRFGQPPTLQMDSSQLPLLRFLEEPRIYYPGVELIADAELSESHDPYLADHEWEGRCLFPGVMGLEAMVQAAMATTGRSDPPELSKIEFLRPITPDKGGKLTVRLAALDRSHGTGDVVLRSAESGFQLDHFKLRFQYGQPPGSSKEPIAAHWKMPCQEVPLEPATDLYGSLLFQSGRFARIRRYFRLKAKECIAELGGDGSERWFGQYLPGELVLGDAGIRDAALHAIQACIPHARILPVGIDRMTFLKPLKKPCYVRACERSQEDASFVYDVELTGENGTVMEQWEGVHLKAVETMPRMKSWPPGLMGPYLERNFRDLFPAASLEVLLGTKHQSVHMDTGEILHLEILSENAGICRRPDGKPEVTRSPGPSIAEGPSAISFAHSEGFSLAAASIHNVGCDMEFVRHRSRDTWEDLLGRMCISWLDQWITEGREAFDLAATRAWVAQESLKKAGLRSHGALMFQSVEQEGWVLVRSDKNVVATCVATLNGCSKPVVFGLLEDHGNASF